jgi:biofilm PGA synthesis protein PgaA
MTASKLALCLIGASFYSSASLGNVTAQDYDALILQARQGNYAPGLAMLRQRGMTHPHDLRAAYDHILIASWAGRQQESIAAYEALRPAPERLPAEVLATVARAYRDTQRWDAALAHYHRGKLQYPKNATFFAGEVMTLTDAGRASEAVKAGEALVQDRPDNVEARMALAYAYRATNSHHAALEASDQAHAKAPNNRYALQQYIVSLKDARLSRAALEVANRHRDQITAEQMRDLEADWAAELTRLASAPAHDRTHQYVIADRAIANYDRLLSDWKMQGSATQQEMERLQADRLQALHARMRMREVVQEYEGMLARGVAPPRYVLTDVADAYLHLQQPEAAANLYWQLVKDDQSQHDVPIDRLNAQAGLHYALLESEQFDQAAEIIEQARGEHARWRYVKGSKERLPNDLYLYVEQTAALGKLYSDDKQQGYERLKKLAETAPNNVSLRTNLADAYRSRGLPRHAEQELKLAEALEPRAQEVIAAQAGVALDLQEWRQAQALIEDATARFPEALRTQHLQRDWNRYKKAELQITTEYGKASGDSGAGNPITGINNLKLQTKLYSAPIDYNWRAFGGIGYAKGKFQDEDRDARWALAGVQYRARNVTAELEGNVSRYGYGDKPGMRAQIDYSLSDEWAIGGQLEVRTPDIDLRALSENITANRITTYARWQPNELRDWTLWLSPTRFSDGNQRMSVALSGRERVYTSPHLKADLGLNIAASRNNKEDTPYFNPRSDLDVSPSVTLTHTLYRRYETSVEQTFIVGAGLYAQHGYGSALTGQLGYGLRFRNDEHTDIGVTVTAQSRPYDGVRERQLRVMLSMNFRF